MMGNRTTLNAFAKTAALAAALVGSGLGCGGSAPGTDPSAESTGSTSEEIRARDCNHGGDDATGNGDDPVTLPPASDCGGTVTTACSITSAFTPNTYRSLAAALANVPDGDVLTIRGTCDGATVRNRIGLTFQGQMPTTGCGFTGPSPTLLRGQVKGLNVVNSTNISVRFLNLVNATGNGLLFQNSVTPLVTCVCAAHNAASGIRLDGTDAAVVSQSVSEGNALGIKLFDTSTVIVSNNTVKANTGNGIDVEASTGSNVSFNIVTGNGGFGLSFVDVSSSLASGNTLTGNTLGPIRCVRSDVFGACPLR